MVMERKQDEKSKKAWRMQDGVECMKVGMIKKDAFFPLKLIVGIYEISARLRKNRLPQLLVTL